MDDFFNFIPARLSALCMIAGAGMLHLDNRNALRIYRRDRSKHKSPNAGQTDSNQTQENATWNKNGH